MGWEERWGSCSRGGLEQHNGAAEKKGVVEGRRGRVWKSLLIGSSWSCGCWWWWWCWGCCCCCRRWWWWWWCSSDTPLSHSLFSGDSDTVWRTPTTPLTPLCPCMSFWMAGQCWGGFCCCCWRVAAELWPTTALPTPSPTACPPIMASCPLSEHPAMTTFSPLEFTAVSYVSVRATGGRVSFPVDGPTKGVANKEAGWGLDKCLCWEPKRVARDRDLGSECSLSWMRQERKR